MKAEKRTEKAAGRYCNIEQFADYAGLGISTARKAAKAIGAERRIGKRCVYDTKTLDDYLQTHDGIELKDAE